MSINYKKTYLTDGTPVKITEELFNQLRDWERQGYQFHFSYIDLLKQQDDEMINKNRNYYLHNVSYEDAIRNGDDMKLLDMHSSPEEIAVDVERRDILLSILYPCSVSQRRRFLKYYYLGFSYAEIARHENCSEGAVRHSIRKTEKIIIQEKSLL